MHDQNNTPPVLITHEVSNLGRLNITLHGIAAEFYNKLEKDGLIDYLKRLDHLGFISKSHPGNHHKRWDYVCLQLFLIQKLKHSAFNTGLTAKTKVALVKISNQELLQFFVLFANIGHLEGTVSSEKALLDYLEQNSAAKQEFLANIKGQPFVSAIVDNIFEGKDYYKIKYLISLNYLLANSPGSGIVSAIGAIQKYLSGDEKLEKLRTIYYRVRKVCFIYLDSYHCRTPLQINISKILINIFNYDGIFNPVANDYSNVLEACETVLTKEIYISPISTLTYKINHEAFKNYLNKYKTGGKRVSYSNFLLSIIRGRREKFELKFADFPHTHVFQFYLAKDSIRIFDIPFNQDFQKFIMDLYEREIELESKLTHRLNRKLAKFIVQHDMRGTLLFFSFVFRKRLNLTELRLVLKNYTLTFIELLGIFQVKKGILTQEFENEISSGIRNDLIRRYFLYVLKLVFEKESRLNVYVKFYYRQVQQKLNRDELFSLYEANFAPSLEEYAGTIDKFLEMNIPAEIRNTIKLLRQLPEEHSSIKNPTCYLFSILPIEIEKKSFDPGDLDQSGNSETREVITDVDSILVISNQEKVELFLIEGKNKSTGFKKACMKDLEFMKSLGVHSDIFQNPVIFSAKGNFKGGFIKIALQ